MCPGCFSSGFASFPSYWEFEAFEAELQQKLMQQQLLPLPRTPTPELTAMAPEQLYQCPVCNETWSLSSPDNAWRGYFLPEAEAQKRQQRLQRTDAGRQVGCLLVMGMLLLWLLKQLM